MTAIARRQNADALRAVPKATPDKRHAIFLTVIDEILKLNCAEIRTLATASGVHWVTLHGWAAGRVCSPRINTLLSVAVQLGYTVELKKQRRLQVAR